MFHAFVFYRQGGYAWGGKLMFYLKYSAMKNKIMLMLGVFLCSAFVSLTLVSPAPAFQGGNDKCLAQKKNGDYCCADCELRSCSSSPDCDGKTIDDQ